MLKVKLIFAFNLKPTFTAEYLLMTLAYMSSAKLFVAVNWRASKLIILHYMHLICTEAEQYVKESKHMKI